MDRVTRHRRAGFAVRLGALWIDILIVGLSVAGVAAIAAHLGVYIPFELTGLLASAGYLCVLTGWKQTTAGKALWGLEVSTVDGRRVGWVRAACRETVGKVLSAVFLGVGFLWVAFAPSGRGWHDRLAGTVVRAANPGRWRRAVAVSLVAAGCVAPAYAIDLGSLLVAYVGVAPPINARPRYAKRPASELVEVSSLSSADESRLGQWIASHGVEPVDYAVAKAKQFQLVIFGEEHEQRESLLFLNHAIPQLYHRARVTCVAMEVFKARDNSKLERLVTAPAFDRAAALDLARATDPWGGWGWQEYWAVMETVWRLNKSLPVNSPRMRLVGLTNPIDLQSIAMAASRRGTSSSSHVAWWERLRLVRLPYQLTRMAAYDTFMAYEAERQIFERGARGIIWVGAGHASMHVPSASGSSAAVPKMGFTLTRRHAGQIGTIFVHHRFRGMPPEVHVRDSRRPCMTEFIERIMDLAGGRPAGFDVAETPFGSLRDRGALWFYHPRVELADLASGYLYLGKLSSVTRCTWVPDYLTPYMFARNKPFYRSQGVRFGRRIDTAADFNRMMAAIDEKY
jgi:uncharacterized RDD family membrane protein YckC